MALPSDITIVGTVLAFAVAILLLSGLALYVAFRIRETLRDEKGGSARTVKVAFLVGLLFLSGGVFYFFAPGFNVSGESSSTQVTSASTTATSSVLLSSTSASTSSTSTPSTTSTTVTTTTTAVGGTVTMSVAYPSAVGVGQGFYIEFSVYNSGSTALTQASIDVGSLGISFIILNATMCNPQCSVTSWSGSVVNLGSLNPGATTVTLGVKAPSSPTQFSGQSALHYQTQTQAIVVTITIRVSGRP